MRQPSDLLKWRVVKGDNPILSTDTVVDPATKTKYPASAPLVNVTGADALTAAQVAPFTPPGVGFTTSFFSGRVYDPQAVFTNERTVTIVFAGYNTPTAEQQSRRLPHDRPLRASLPRRLLCAAALRTRGN